MQDHVIPALPAGHCFKHNPDAHAAHAESDKNVCSSEFDRHYDEHIQMCAEICKLSHRPIGANAGGLCLNVFNRTTLGTAWAQSNDSHMIKKMCWCLYHTHNAVHNRFFFKSMTEMFEEEVMQKHNWSYMESSHGSEGKSSIRRFFNQRITKLRSRVLSRSNVHTSHMTRISIENPVTTKNKCEEGVVHTWAEGHKPLKRRSTNSLHFYIGMRGRIDNMVVCTWQVVRTGTLSLDGKVACLSNITYWLLLLMHSRIGELPER